MTPYTYFLSIWDRCNDVEKVHTSLLASGGGSLASDELLRAEWVARVSALDLFVHELVAQNMVQIFEGLRPNCRGFGRFMCDSDTLVRVRNAGSTSAASAAFDLEVRSRLGRLTFQSPDDIADGIRNVSDCELWNEVAEVLGASSATRVAEARVLKKSLSLIVERRNKIVHEGDLQPSIPRVPWGINRADLFDVAGVIERIARGINAIV